MQALYTPEDRAQVEAQRRGIRRWMLVISILMAVLITLSFIVRIEWLTVALTVLWGGALIFLWDLKLNPLRAYLKFLQEMETGLRREETGTVVLFEAEPSFREGRRCWRLLLNVSEDMSEEGERQYFYDANKPRPGFAPGQRVTLEYQGSEVLAYRIEEAPDGES